MPPTRTRSTSTVPRSTRPSRTPTSTATGSCGIVTPIFPISITDTATIETREASAVGRHGRASLRNRPAGAERLVDGDQGSGCVGAALGEQQLGAERGALRIEDLEEIDESTLEPLAREVRGLVARSGRQLQGVASGLRASVGDHRALGILEGAEHGALILRKRRVGLGAGFADSGQYAAHVEGCPGDARTHRVKARLALAEFAERGCPVADLTGQRYLGEEIS